MKQVPPVAIYDNFDDKDDLLFEEYKAYSSVSPPLFITGLSFEEQAPRVCDALIAMASRAHKHVAQNAELNSPGNPRCAAAPNCRA